MANSTPRSTLALTLGGIVLLALGGAGGWLFEKNRGASLNRTEVEQVVREYILANPEILPAAIEKLRARENAKQVAGSSDTVFEPFPGAVLGNPAGKITLVEFTDFACTFCRSSIADVEALIKENPELRVVIRELPIIAPTSPDAARWGLAAAEQGRYPAVDVLASLSRLAGRVWVAEQAKAASDMKRLIARFEETRDLRAMGGYVAGADSELDRAVEIVPKLYQLLSQSLGDPLSVSGLGL